MLHAKNKNGKVSYIQSYRKRNPSGCLLTKLDTTYTEKIFFYSGVDVRINEMVLRCNEAVRISCDDIIKG
jgi:hypothetical protein